MARLYTGQEHFAGLIWLFMSTFTFIWLFMSTVVQLPLSPIEKGRSNTDEVRTHSVGHCLLTLLGTAYLAVYYYIPYLPLFLYNVCIRYTNAKHGIQ